MNAIYPLQTRPFHCLCSTLNSNVGTVLKEGHTSG